LLQLLGQLDGAHRSREIGANGGAQRGAELYGGGTVVDHIDPVDQLLQELGAEAKVRFTQLTHHGDHLR